MNRKTHIDETAARVAFEHALATYEQDFGKFFLARLFGLELTYTAHDLQPWAADLGYDGQPFPWNPDRRAVLRAELDAYYAKLYGLTRDEFAYILDTFPVLRRKEIAAFGEYQSKRKALEEFERFTL